MSPLPLEGLQGPAGYVPSGQEGPRGGSISLSMLIDFIIQRTYHDLTVLAELLPRKTDMERKIEIYNFSARTRQLFIRLLALVKWANSASKVDKSAHIMNFLDKQSMLFVDTADMLARMARETLVHARLPNFHIPAAIEILTTGTYSRLPACIRERIVPPDPITASEKKQTLLRLNQVIQHRLVTGNLMPQMRKFKIDCGRVTFHVEHEFEVSLTVMGDGPNVPWRLLEIEILVEDKETGDGKALVHTQQVLYIHQLIQARIVDNPNALTEVYNCLHHFCQSLQLEVLYTQTLRLINDRLDENIHVDEYKPGSKLTVSYWRELTCKDPKSELGYKLTVQTDPNDKARPLAVLHLPTIGNKESSEVADRAVRSDLLSMERLLVHTVYIRSLSRLNDIKVEFQTFLKDVEYHLQGTPAILTVPVLNPCLRAEQIHITVDTHTGMLRCHVPKHLDCPISPELQTALNVDLTKLPHLVSELRYWVTQRRCEKTLQHLPATPYERLPLLHSVDHPLTKIGRHKIFVKLHRHPTVILIVEIKERPTNVSEMDFTFYLALVKHSSIDDSPNDDSIETDIPKMYFRVQNLIEFDTFAVTHGPGTYVDECSLNKRKSSSADGGPLAKQKTIYPAYFIPELAHVVAMCDEKLPFVCLAQELSRRNIPHSGLQVEANASSVVLKLLTLPQPDQSSDSNKMGSCPVISKTVWNALMRRLLSVAIRSQINKNNHTRLWTIELVFCGTPLQSTHNREQGSRRTVYYQYELLPSEMIAKTIDSLLSDWSKIVYLYSIVHEFAEQHENEKNLQNLVTIKSYSYNNLLLGYGPNKDVTVNIFWCTDAAEFKMLQSHLNRHYSLSQIVHILHETYQPLSSLAKLPVIPQLGIPRSQVPIMSFCMIPQSPTLIRIAYQAMYCLEIRLRGGGLISIRDGAYSRFDRSNVVDEFYPTQGLKGFLSKYVDESAVYRRRSQSEDDNPPSPIAMEETQGGPASVGGSSPFLGGSLRAPQSPRDGGLRFAPPITPPTSSNPHTPASPHPINQNHPNFGMTSPPASHMPHPSPSAGIMPSSPLNPSPMAHSPGPNMQYMQHTDNSPFSALSPAAAASNWPGSPSMPRPSPRPGQSPDHKSQSQPMTPHVSRVLPPRSWAGAVPTLLTHEALDSLCRPSPHPQKEIPGPEQCPLERFLGCVYMRRHLQRFVHSEEYLQGITSTEPGVVLFKVDGLQGQVFLDPAHMQSLHIKVTQVPPTVPDGKPPYQWNLDDLQIIEQFFETRVAAPPYRPNALSGFTRMLNVPSQVLKDFIQIIRVELMPDILQGLKWHVQFCLRVPPSAAPIVPVGNPAIHIVRLKILFFLQITRIPYLPQMDWKDSPSLVLPMVYDVSSNITQIAERRDPVPSIATSAASHQLRRFAEYPSHGECSLFPAVRDLIMNLTLPNEQQPNPNQIIPSPAGAVGNCPSPMMHSPMQGVQGVQGVQGGPQGYGMGTNQGPNQV
ncbi:Mediator of RNA polymerase II transcription subunit 14 [Pseudolycoriella hygida]|uniref:Mediator of RNA polymerase II transcription subunit 14 n=1 Tax=Pseudolycoriella hygida TaxID=35572 RepID=A0A9Q0MLC7_9DIPT|nr:Mediator of RNA polymerase II transcription subunit 14 [Pseudolycoriella hygida]